MSVTHNGSVSNFTAHPTLWISSDLCQLYICHRSKKFHRQAAYLGGWISKKKNFLQTVQLPHTVACSTTFIGTAAFYSVMVDRTGVSVLTTAFYVSL